MSRNYELLQRVLQRNSAGAPSLSPLTSTDTSEPVTLDAGGRVDATAVVGAKLLAADLQPEERRELLKLITAIFRPQDGVVPRCIAFCGIDTADSASWIAACAGELMVQNLGGEVCVVDANLYDSSLHHLLELPPAPGLFDAVVAETSALSVCRRVAARLWVLTAGSPAAPPEAQTVSALGAELQQLRTQFPYILVVGPPLKKSVDLLSFASVVDGALLVVDADSTRRADALAAKQCLLAGRVPLLGAILDNHKFLPDWLYGHL